MYSSAAGQARFVITNPDLIFNFQDLSEKQINEIKTHDWGQYPYSKGLLSCEFSLGNEPKILSELFQQGMERFKIIDKDVELLSVHRQGLHLTSTDLDNPLPIHADSFEFSGFWTILVHLTGTMGQTKFYNNHIHPREILAFDFSPGRILIFPSLFAHSGTKPIDGTFRYTMNYRVLVKTHLNNLTLSKSKLNYAE